MIINNVLSMIIESIAVEDADGLCVFPFTFNSVEYNDCIENLGTNTSWCSLTSNYDTDNMAGDCIKGNLCVNQTSVYMYIVIFNI